MKPQTGTQNWLKPPNGQITIDPLANPADTNVHFETERINIKIRTE